MVNNIYPVVTLCGSTKFKDDFIRVQKELTLKGFIVISVGLFGHSGDSEAMTKETKEMLDDMHKCKIDMAGTIYVINKNGYIGNSTRSEIAYAKSQGKQIVYMERNENGKWYEPFEVASPHGRLIDANRLRYAIMMMSRHPCGAAIENVDDVISILKEDNLAAPTIIKEE